MLFLFIIFSGCNNPCQKLCDEIQNYAEECDFDFSKELQKECSVENRWLPKEDRQECALALPKLREEWTCDDIQVYFDDDDELFSSDETEVGTTAINTSAELLPHHKELEDTSASQAPLGSSSDELD